MKKIIMVCIAMFALLQYTTANTISKEDKQLRDSLFRVFHTPTMNDSTRVKFMHKIFQDKIIGRDWAAELLDSAMVAAVRGNYVKGEIVVYYDYFRQSLHLADSEAMRRNIKQLKAISAKYQSYDLYFAAWSSMLSFNNACGDTENAILEAHRMSEEARQVANVKGLFLARYAEGVALARVNRNDEALKLFHELLGIKGIPTMDRINLLAVITAEYRIKKAYDKALFYLKMVAAEMDMLLKEDKGEAAHHNKLFELELHFCKLYTAMGNAQDTYKHLKRSERYYSADKNFSLRSFYLESWAYYYSMIEDWDKCIRQCDKVLTISDTLLPFGRLDLQRVKANALMKNNQYGEATKLQRRVAVEMDSLNHAILKRHMEVHRANYTIRQSLLNKETAEMRYNQLKMGGIITLAIMLFGLLLRAFYIHHILKRSEHEIQEALNEVKAADKMKEVFLGNITHEIRTPLNAVVGFSELLSTDSELTQEEKQQYAGLIKRNAERLTKLVFDILDLSRLESGMMKFDVQLCDAVQLCRDAKMMVDMQEGNSIHLEFDTALNTLPIQVDSGRFMKLLGSVLSATRENCSLSLVKYHLGIDKGQLKITVSGSPLLEPMENEESDSLPNRIQHDVNRIYLRIFNGSYRTEKADANGKKLIIITYPF